MSRKELNCLQDLTNKNRLKADTDVDFGKVQRDADRGRRKPAKCCA